MGRNKGESYRKWKLKENPRKKCPRWTIEEETLEQLKVCSTTIGVCPSRIVEAAIKIMLASHPQKMKDFSKILHKN